MWWPLGARFAMAFVRHGCKVSAVCPPGHPMRFISGIDSLHPYKGLGSAASLKAAILATRPDLIVPCDDGVVWQLHELHANNPDLRPLIERSLGDKEAYPTLQKRGEMLQAAAELHIRVPQTETVRSANDLNGWCVHAPAVLKLDGTWGGEGVIIAPTQDAAKAAFRRLSKPFSAYLAWKRFLINHDPLALWSWRRQAKSSVTVQEFIQGRPANTMFACWNGEILAIVTVEVLASQGATGAATVVRVVQNEEIERAARLLAKKFKLSGFHGLDFILEEQSRAAFLIELNPRCTQLGHLDLLGVGDLAGAVCAKLLDRSAQESAPATRHKQLATESTVAFFPQALNWNPKSEYLSRGFHDVPWEEPALVRELLRRSWPERQLLSRIYHYFRAPKRPEEVKFADESSARMNSQRYPLPISEDNLHAAKAVEKTAVNG
jgi:hypothetical protein